MWLSVCSFGIAIREPGDCGLELGMAVTRGCVGAWGVGALEVGSGLTLDVPFVLLPGSGFRDGFGFEGGGGGLCDCDADATCGAEVGVSGWMRQ